MIVLIAIPCLLVGGTEIQTLRLVQALTEEGYHCVIVCYFEYDIHVVQMFEQAGGRVICLSAYGKRPDSQYKIYRFLKSGFKRVVKEFRPKIAHVQYMAPGAIPIVILRQLGIKTIIATLHTDAGIYRSLRLIHFLNRHLVRVFTCVSESAEKSFFTNANTYTLIHSHSSIPKHITIPNCLSPNAKIIQHDLPEHPTIGLVSRLEAIKGVDLVMPAFTKVLEKIPDCKLLIIGDGKLKETMERQQQELGISEESVIWTGRVPYDSMPAFYSQMSLLWMPSRNEGFGLTAIEAMANGRPVIASSVGGLNDIIHEGTDGFLVSKDNPEQLAAKTISILSNYERLKSLSQNALNTAEQYTFERYKDTILSLYSKL